MNFAELRFWGLLFAGLGVIFLARRAWRSMHPTRVPQFDRVALIGLGMFLLLCVSWLTFAIWLAVALGSYAGLDWVLRHDPNRRLRYLAIFIPLQLAPLAYYKYADFALNGVLKLDLPFVHGLLIPVGISFYTFQKVAFVLDTLAFKEPLPRFLDYLNFAGFFPQIVAGPIERKRDLLPQMERFEFRWNRADIDDGARWVALGLFFKCCLADNLANWLPPFMGATHNAYMVWAANALFGLRIYYDFAGYSLVAYGIARCLGVRLTLNFVSPYCSTSIQEFWRRWHVTLSNWFRDYVYIPLGGGRVGRWAVNVMVVFVVSGLWHGAGWNFVLWGGLHGAYLVVQRASGKWKMPAFPAWVLTMLGAGLAWMCFYETRMDFLWPKLACVANPSCYSVAALKESLATLRGAEAFVLLGLLAMAGVTLVLEWRSIRLRNEPFALLRQTWVLTILIVLAVWLAPGKNNAFIYFAF